MAKLTELLGNRELAWEDNLEKGRIWVYSDGNMYSAFCNGFCWKPPGCGKAIIEIWGSAGSSAEMCCCGAGLNGNPGGYVKKCICVCPSNFVCGYVGRSCNNSDDLCFRGCGEATCVCWYGCSATGLWADGEDPKLTTSWKGNNPWGWGNDRNGLCGWTNRAEGGSDTHQAGGRTTGRTAVLYCCDPGHNTGCLCAQGGRGGISYCMDTKSPYSCFITGYFCATRVGPGHNMCDTGNSACGRVCNWCQNGFNNAGAWGGDINCCGGYSCTDFLSCIQTSPCGQMQHITTSAGVYATEGATISFFGSEDATNASWAGTMTAALVSTLPSLSRSPSYGMNSACWVGARSCGCYNMQGCMNFLPYGVPGAAAVPCGAVRDHGMRGGMGMVRIKYVPTDGGNTY